MRALQAIGLATLAGCATLASEHPVGSARTCVPVAVPIVASLVTSASTIAGTALALDAVTDERRRAQYVEAAVPVAMLGVVAATVALVGFRSVDDCEAARASQQPSAWHSNGALGAR